MMNWKETPPSDCKVRSVVQFVTIENNFGAEMHCHLCATYGKENVMNLRGFVRGKPNRARLSGSKSALETNVHKSYVACMLNARPSQAR